ncbi:glycosyltransferase family 117 protein [Halocola ammonii]
MNFQRTNVITGWVVFLIATIVYALTLEPTASFWDAGEFIASAYKLEVGHPPGAPFYMLISRFFAMLVPMEYAAISINMVSALSSSFTILFLFWTITHLAKKVAVKTEELNPGKLIGIMGAGVVGALAYTFSDSFWFSAVEGEVYAMSSLFTAIVFWAILKWETLADRKGELRWIILIAFLMGLSIGVHLLNLLAIPAICFVYYFKRYEVRPLGILYTSLVAVFVLGLIQAVIIPGTVKFAAAFELFFVNDLGMGFNSGVLIYAILVIAILVGALYITQRKRLYALNTLSLGVTMVLIGYSTFALIVIRSSANPPMDENNPENLFTLLSYLNREQYGDRPLIFGQYWNTPQDQENPYTDGNDTYFKSFSVRSNGNLVESFDNEFAARAYADENGGGNMEVVEEYLVSISGDDAKPNYDSDLSTIFPRMYSSQANHIAEYKNWSNYKGWNNQRDRQQVQSLEQRKQQIESQEIRRAMYFMQNPQNAEMRQQAEQQYRALSNELEGLNRKLKPSFGENLKYFFNFQVGWMYGRYFMWNFAGKQNDIQGHSGMLDGNWLSGVDFIDQERLGNRAELSERYASNKGLNHFYLLPLILGLIGLIFQLLRAPKDFTVVMLLFFFTGLAIVLYLNQTPLQPRERDYAYAGSFYAYAIWIGLGVYALYYAATKMNWNDIGKVGLYAGGTGVFLFLLESVLSDGHSFSYTILYMTVVTLLAMGLMQLLKQGSVGVKGRGIAAALICLAVPAVMAIDGWDDHNRARRKTSIAFAKNYLNTLEKNAILFTNGDNDTFPLWYAQEVEGVRTDVRVVNLSLLNTDWYISQMKRQAYESEPVPFDIAEQKYRQGTRDVVILDNSRNKKDKYIELDRALEIALNDDFKTTVGDNKKYSFMPTNKFALPVDSAQVIQTGTVSPEKADQIVDTIKWTIPGQYILKNNLAVLSLLENNNWERPIYFAVTTGQDAYIGLEDYFQLEGLAYRLVPIKEEGDRSRNAVGGINEDRMYENIMKEFEWGNMDDTTNGIYMDENNRRMTTNLRLQFANLANELTQEGQEEKAIEILDKSMEVMPEVNVPFDRVMLPIAEAYYELGEDEKGNEIVSRLFDLAEDDLEYFFSLSDERQAMLSQEIRIQLSVATRIESLVNDEYPQPELGPELQQRLDALMEAYSGRPAPRSPRQRNPELLQPQTPDQNQQQQPTTPNPQ